MSNPSLTICIPTIIGRERQFDTLVASIQAQADDYDVDILSCCDDKEMSIGAKRDMLYREAKGEYCIQIDDDDHVCDDFLKVAFKYLQDRPDCVTYLERVTENGIERICCHSNRFKEWGNHVEGYHYVRTPFNKDIIRTDIVQQIGFKDMRYGEDADFSKRLKQSGLIKKEAFIDRVMYYYTANSLSAQEHNKRYGIK